MTTSKSQAIAAVWGPNLIHQQHWVIGCYFLIIWTCLVVAESIKNKQQKISLIYSRKKLCIEVYDSFVFVVQPWLVVYTPTYPPAHLHIFFFLFSLYSLCLKGNISNSLKSSKFKHTTNNNIKPFLFFSNSSIHNIYVKEKENQTQPKAC